MYEIKDTFYSQYEIKKSKFIAHLIPFRFNQENIYKEYLENLKKEHTKARHFVYAYRFLNEFGQIVENCSDDGEPKGTSGKPSLKVLQGKNLINTAVIIIRYFGGIKLGTGGLVRAYSDAVNQVINISNLSEYLFLKQIKIELDYNELSKIEYFLNKNEINIIQKEYNEKVLLELESTDEKLNLFYIYFRDFKGILL